MAGPRGKGETQADRAMRELRAILNYATAKFEDASGRPVLTENPVKRLSKVKPRADEAYQLYLTKYKQMGASYPQVLISQRTMFQLRQQYINALVNLQQNATSLEGYLLTGGLDAPSLTPGSIVQRVEMTGVRSGSQGSDQHDLDTAGLVEY